MFITEETKYKFTKSFIGYIGQSVPTVFASGVKVITIFSLYGTWDFWFDKNGKLVDII